MRTSIFSTNPFFLLGVSIRSNREEIAAAYDEALVAGHHDEVTLQKTQQTLMAPRPRLDAELTWMPELTPARARDVVMALQRTDLAPDDTIGLLRDVNGLARTNIAAALCLHFPGRLDHAIALAEAHAGLTPAAVTQTIAAVRAAAGFTKPDVELVAQALARLVEMHAKAVVSSLTIAPHPGQSMTALVRLKERHDERLNSFIETVIKHYDQWSAPKLRDIGDTIDKEIAQLRGNSDLVEPARHIADLLLEWDELSQPSQLIAQSQGLNELRSKQLIDRLRALCLWLANDKQAFAPALAICKSILGSFAELPFVAQQLPNDVATLEGLIKQSTYIAQLAPLQQAIAAAEASLPSLAAAFADGGFGEGVRGRAKEIYDAFIVAARTMHTSEEPSAPWLIMRDLSIRLHNQEQMTAGAHAIVIGLRRVDVPRPPEVDDLLRQDERTLLREMKMQDLQRAASLQDLAAGARLADEILALSDTPEDRSVVQGIKDSIITKQRGRRVKWAVGLGIAAVITFFVIWDEIGANKQRPRYTTSSGSTSSTTYAPTSTTSGQSTTSSDPLTQLFDEERPPVAKGVVLTTRQVRYCLYQFERLEFARPLLLTESESDRFNVLIDDYNARCADARYWQNTSDEIKQMLWQVRPRLKKEAETIVQSWHQAPTAGASTSPTSSSSGVSSSSGSSSDTTTVRLFDLDNPVDAKLVQQRLKELGFYAGAIDGAFGEQSKQALRTFKSSRRLTLDSTWDLATQWQLFNTP